MSRGTGRSAGALAAAACVVAMGLAGCTVSVKAGTASSAPAAASSVPATQAADETAAADPTSGADQAAGDAGTAEETPADESAGADGSAGWEPVSGTVSVPIMIAAQFISVTVPDGWEAQQGEGDNGAYWAVRSSQPVNGHATNIVFSEALPADTDGLTPSEAMDADIAKAQQATGSAFEATSGPEPVEISGLSGEKAQFTFLSNDVAITQNAAVLQGQGGIIWITDSRSTGDVDEQGALDSIWQSIEFS